jgi:hypothetical protein
MERLPDPAEEIARVTVHATTDRQALLAAARAVLSGPERDAARICCRIFSKIVDEIQHGPNPKAAAAALFESQLNPKERDSET